MSHKLWVFHGGAAPRRIVIYLAERHFPSTFINTISTTISGPGEPALAPGKPPGPVPLLQLPSGELISESLSILEYFEDVASSQNMPSMRGDTVIERAKVRTLLGLIETVTLSVEIAAVNGSVAFSSLVEGQQSAGIERWLLAFIHKNLERISQLAAQGVGPLLGGIDVTTADCALFATLQYAEELWGLDLVREKHPRLKMFYEAFAKRASSVVPENTWPKEMTEFTRQFITY